MAEDFSINYSVADAAMKIQDIATPENILAFINGDERKGVRHAASGKLKELGAEPLDSDTKLVKMVRSEEEAGEGQPTTAEVHPDEVVNYALGGWKVKE